MPRQQKTLRLIIGDKAVDQIKRTSILVVGAGGIGCQVVKNLTKIGITAITILDFDTIEETNLNRQFYFRKEHIGRYKAFVIKEQIQKYYPQIKVVALCDRLQNPIFNDLFFSSFSIIISALDSIKARQYLASQCTRSQIPLIDAGTMSYNGQAYASIRFMTTCHNCQQSKGDVQVTPACLVRSRPQRPIHCGTYAKNFYQSFFGNQGEIFSERLNVSRFVNNGKKIQSRQQAIEVAKKVFNQLFNQGLSVLTQNNSQQIRKLSLQYALSSKQPLLNPVSTSLSHSLYQQQQILSLHVYSTKFLQSFTNLLLRKSINSHPNQFNKDDQDCMTLICSITNLRTYNYLNIQSKDNQLRYVSYYQCKDMVGRVMPAIASSNSIAASLQTRQLLNIISKRYDRLKMIHFTNVSDQRLSPCYQGEPLIDCHYCSQKNIYVRLQLDMEQVLIKQFQEFAQKELFSFGRDVYSGSYVLVRNSRKSKVSNKDKKMSFVGDLVKNGVLNISFSGGGSDVNVNVTVVHKEGAEGIRIVSGATKQEMRRQLLKYYRKKHHNQTIMKAFQLRNYGCI